MLYIDAIREIEDSHGCTVIGHVKATEYKYLQASSVYSKADMIAYINKYPNGVKTKYKIGGGWAEGETVRVVDNSYIRTDANRVLRDNLGNLPKF